MRIKHRIRAYLLALALVAGSAACASPKSAPTAQPTIGASPAANGYSYGYGTYYVATRRSVPPNWGNAKTWYAYAQRDGYSVGDTPKKGAIAWSGRGLYGQVAIVEEVNASSCVGTAKLHDIAKRKAHHFRLDIQVAYKKNDT
ncbi:MAG TPA: CHAP domain-containing protein, partial [Candidatus Saccharimonadales bacterium]|nr:CHAP domain-containing protein [Candidatus Saccharimonadales bacterium]